GRQSPERAVELARLLAQQRRRRRADALERVVLEREELQLAKAPTRLQLAHEPPRPAVALFGVRPQPGQRALHAGSAELDVRIDGADRAGGLEVEVGVVLRPDELAVGLLAEFDAADRPTAPLDVADLGGGVLGRVVPDADRDQHRSAAGKAAR